MEVDPSTRSAAVAWGRKAATAVGRLRVPAAFTVVAVASVWGWLVLAHSPGMTAVTALLGSVLGGFAAGLWSEATVDEIPLRVIALGAVYGVLGLVACVGGWSAAHAVGLLMAGCGVGILVVDNPPTVAPVAMMSPDDIRRTVSVLTVESLLHLWSRAGSDDGRLPAEHRTQLTVIRGILMDELEQRDPTAFIHWMESGAPTDPASFRSAS